LPGTTAGGTFGTPGPGSGGCSPGAGDVGVGPAGNGSAGGAAGMGCIGAGGVISGPEGPSTIAVVGLRDIGGSLSPAGSKSHVLNFGSRFRNSVGYTFFPMIVSSGFVILAYQFDQEFGDLLTNRGAYLSL